MKARFEMAGGSVIGREHLRIGQNNQDAHYGVCAEDWAIAVVCDGCGSCPHSEVGAKLGARLVVEAIARSLVRRRAKGAIGDSFWQQIQQDILDRLQSLAKAMGGDFPHTLLEHFLFTIVGFLITPAGAWVFSIGDGVIVVNGQIQQLGPFPQNAPPYLTYGLLDPSLDGWQFQIRQQLPIDEVESILIGTDGVADLIAAADRHFPGKKDLIGPIEQFWKQDRYFTNPDMVRRQLATINREAMKANWQEQKLFKEVGLLPDDTTLMVIRKRK